MTSMASIATVNLKALKSNLRYIQNVASGCDILAMVKANAYGHGMLEIAKALQNFGVNHFGVATIDEARQLRDFGILSQILLTGGATWISQVDELVSLEITPFLGGIEEIHALGSYLQENNVSRLQVHLDLDTGMGRTGFVASCEESMRAMFQALGCYPQIVVKGLGTHFASADCEPSYSAMQMKCFYDAVSKCELSGIRAEVLHVANSAGILNGLSQGGEPLKTLWGKYRFWIRPGIALYGISPLEAEHADLAPILTWKARIVARKRMPEGSLIGYGNTYKCIRPTELAIVGAGYADGVSRAQSNLGEVIIGSKRCPILGRVSMDLIAVDVSELVLKKGKKECEVSQWATLIGGEGSEEILASELAKKLDTIPYEILTSIGHRVKRCYTSLFDA